MASKKHPGFKAVAKSIEAKEGVSKERADAILAASSRGASAKAKRANPRLNKVSGGKAMMGAMRAMRKGK